MNTLPAADLAVLLVYLLAVVALGCWFVRRSSSTEEFMAAGRALPGWAVGLSIFGTYLSSNTFIGVPGQALSGNWNFFVFSLSLPIAAMIATWVFVPFYRRSGEISAYQHLERRFGKWARNYAMICYLLTQVARMAAILFGVSLAVTALTGWPQAMVIVLAGGLITLYTVLGGIEAVIWTDVVQSIVLSVGAVLVLVMIVLGMPGGLGQTLEIAQAHDKFSLGSPRFDFTDSTIWVVLLFGVFINLTNFGIDQSFVQRYHTARTESQAKRSVWLAAGLYLPVSALFFFIGTALFAYYTVHPGQVEGLRQQIAEEQLSTSGQLINDQTLEDAASEVEIEQLQDRAFPHFIAGNLPAGMSGLLIAALVAAAMSSVDTSLNSSATVLLTDFYRPYIRPDSDERHSMRVLYGGTVLMGVIGTGASLLMIGIDSILETWWTLSGIIAGGMLGLFLLGVLARFSNAVGAAVAVTIGVLVISWLSFSPNLVSTSWGEQIPRWLINPLDTKMTIVVGTTTILVVGLFVSLLVSGKDKSANTASDLTESST